MKIQQSLTFDDVLIKTNYSSVVPSEVDTKTLLTNKIRLTIPLISYLKKLFRVPKNKINLLVQLIILG